MYVFNASSFHPAPTVSRTKPAVVYTPPAPSGSYRLDAGQVTTLKARATSSLEIHAGRLWVTRYLSEQAPGDDIVLGAGDVLMVPAGEWILVEPWDQHGAAYHWDTLRA
jgi:hypothetical protein